MMFYGKIKKKKADKSRNAPNSFNPSALTWTDNDGVHLLEQGTPPSPDQLDEMTKQFSRKHQKFDDVELHGETVWQTLNVELILRRQR